MEGIVLVRRRDRQLEHGQSKRICRAIDADQSDVGDIGLVHHAIKLGDFAARLIDGERHRGDRDDRQQRNDQTDLRCYLQMPKPGHGSALRVLAGNDGSAAAARQGQRYPVNTIIPIKIRLKSAILVPLFAPGATGKNRAYRCAGRSGWISERW
jgi:hypothetical protein